MKVSIACIQLNSALGNVEGNIRKVQRLVSKIKHEIDILILPECAITGYNFKTRHEMEPYLSEIGNGPSVSLATELSRRFRCHTIIGYPEKFKEKIYNSALVTDDTGKVIHNYRKSHLYETDEAWGSLENPDKSFRPFYMHLGKGKTKSPVLVNLGICMDLNPYKFEAPFFDFEFASACFANESSLILVPTAWLSPDSPSIAENLTADQKDEAADKIRKYWEENPDNPLGDGNAPSQLTVNYWLLRMFPFLGHPANPYPRRNRKTAVVICNRSGIEDQILYGGSSTIFNFDESSTGSTSHDISNPSVNVLGSLGVTTEDILFGDVYI